MKNGSNTLIIQISARDVSLRRYALVVREFKNLINLKFGRWTVLEFADHDKHGCIVWKCICSCGKQKIVSGDSLKSGNSKSCGCLSSELVSIRRKTHGMSKGRTYSSWNSMIGRCNFKNNIRYKDYGGRGITVCKRWLKPNGNGFLNFLKDMEERPKNKTLDRINNNLGYCKENCRWATKEQQQGNTRRNHMETFNGKTQCRSVWEQEYNLSPGTLIRRIDQYKWTIKRALETPMGKYNMENINE